MLREVHGSGVLEEEKKNMNQKMSHSCYLHFVKDGTLGESMSIYQLHVANNICYIVHEIYKLDDSKIRSLIFSQNMKNKHTLSLSNQQIPFIL